MIAKGNHHAHGVKLAAYLVKGHPGERAELFDMRGFGTTSDLREAFRIEAMRARDGTKAEKPFFHVHLRGAAGEGVKISQSQWAEIADRCDRALGLRFQPRAASFHIDRQTGDRHLHLAYSLVATSEDGQGFVKKLGLYKKKLKTLSREIEKDFGLKIVSNDRQPGNLARGADRREFEESRRLGTDIDNIRTTILESFAKSDSGKSFAAAMQARGFEIAAGDRRDCFVVVDQAGGQHALNKKLTGKTLAEIRQRLSDLDRSQLPSVDQAKAIQIDRQGPRQAAQTMKHGAAAVTAPQSQTPSHGPEKGRGGQSKPLPELGKTAGEIRLAWSLTRSGEQFRHEIAIRGLKLVYVTAAEAAASQRAHAFAKAAGRQNRSLKEGFGVVDRRGNVTKIDQRVTGDLWEEIQKRLGGIDKAALVSVAEARETMAARNRAEWLEQKQAERDAARPATATERKILDAAAAVGNDPQQFAAALEQDGIAFARVTMADTVTLDALRKDEMITAAADPGYQPRFIPNVEPGQLVAVDHHGDIHNLNPHHIEHMNRRLERGDSEVAEASGERTTAHPNATEKFKDAVFGRMEPLPSVEAVRSGFEIARQEATGFQQTMIDHQLARRAEQADARMLAFENRQAEAADRATDRALNAAADSAARGVDGVLSGVEKVATAVFEAVAAPLEGIANFLGDLFSAPAPLTKDQAERKIAANAERQAEAADYQAAAAKAQALDDLIVQQQRDESDRRAAPEYFRHITRGDDINRARDDDRGRERER